MAKFIYQWRNTQHGRRLFRVPSTATAPSTTTTVAVAPVVIEAGTAPTSTAADAYDTWLKSDLVEMAEERGLDSTGTKADIIARLEDADDAA